MVEQGWAVAYWPLKGLLAPERVVSPPCLQVSLYPFPIGNDHAD